MASDASICMVKTPERDNQTPGKEGIEEETDTREKASKGNIAIDLSDIQSDKKDTPGKETRGNDDGGDEYLPTPPGDRDQDNQNSTQEEKYGEKEEDELKSTTSENAECTPREVQSEAEQKEVGDSEEEPKEESENRRRKYRGK